MTTELGPEGSPLGVLKERRKEVLYIGKSEVSRGASRTLFFLSILHKNSSKSSNSEINSIICKGLHVLCADLARLMCRF